MTFVAAASANSGTVNDPSPGLTLPTGIQDGDLGFLLFQDNGTNTFTRTQPSGWSTPAYQGPLSGNNCSSWLMTRTMAATDSGTAIAGSISANLHWAAGVVILRGESLDQALSTYTFSDNTTGTGITATGYTPVAANCQIVEMVGESTTSGQGAVTTTGADGTWTEDVDTTTSSSSGANAAVWIGHKTLTGQAGTAQSSPDVTANKTVRANGWIIVLAPVSSSVAASGSASITLTGTGPAASTASTAALTLTGSATARAAATGTAALSLTGSGSTGAPATGTASISLTGSAAGPTVSGTAALALTASGTARASATGSGGLSLTGAGADAAPSTAAASLTLTATGRADPHIPVTPQLDVNFEDGTTGGFNVVQGATVGSSFAHDGTNGVQLAPDGSGFASLTWNGPSGTGHPWAAFRGWFKVVTKTDPANTFVDLMEIGNELTVAPKGQFTVYTKTGDLGIDFNTTDFTVIDPAYTTGTWHLLEARIFFGDTTFTAHVRYDGTEYIHTSANTQTASTVKSLWVQYPSTVTDQTVDWDSIRMWYGDFDPGYLDAATSSSASGTGSLTLTGSAAPSAPEAATASLSLSGTGSAAAVVAGSAAISLAGTGTTAARSSSTASLSLIGSAPAGARAAGTGSLSFTGSGTALAPGGAAGTGSLTLSASASALGGATGSASLTLNATATGRAATSGAASLTLTTGGAASGPRVGAGTAAISLTAAGTAAAQASAAATLTLTATGTATNPSAERNITVTIGPAGSSRWSLSAGSGHDLPTDSGLVRDMVITAGPSRWPGRT